MSEREETGSCPQCGRDASKQSDDIDEPITHCEWCGAEYPSPERASDRNPPSEESDAVM